MNAVVDKVGVALGEASTWRGIIFILTAVGVQLDPEQQTAIITAGLALSGLLGVFFKRKPSAG
jgi:LPXTG-motif cell wall-anchored protein